MTQIWTPQHSLSNTEQAEEILSHYQSIVSLDPKDFRRNRELPSNGKISPIQMKKLQCSYDWFMKKQSNKNFDGFYLVAKAIEKSLVMNTAPTRIHNMVAERLINETWK